MNYNLSNLEKESSYINKMIDHYFDCDVLSSQKIGEGFYGVVNRVDISKEPYRVIVKWYKHSGRNIKEESQLNLLRKYSLLKVPETYYAHKHNEDIPYEALLMEFVEGINASKLPTNHMNHDKFVDEMIGNLIHLHSVSNDKGFGDGEEMFLEWKSCLRKRVGTMHQILHNDYKDSISPYVMKVADESLDAIDKIFAEPIKRSSLIHSDYNLWNILVDEKSAKITAIIDPIDAGWADKEMDLFHLQNADGDRFHLLNHYQQHVKLSQMFKVKNVFYWFWDDIKHMINMGWYDEERFILFGEKFLSLKKEYIGE